MYVCFFSLVFSLQLELESVRAGQAALESKVGTIEAHQREVHAELQRMTQHALELYEQEADIAQADAYTVERSQ